MYKVENFKERMLLVKWSIFKLRTKLAQMIINFAKKLSNFIMPKNFSREEGDFLYAIMLANDETMKRQVAAITNNDGWLEKRAKPAGEIAYAQFSVQPKKNTERSIEEEMFSDLWHKKD
jgi:hypothetical protein